MRVSEINLLFLHTSVFSIHSTVALAMLFEMNGEVPQSPHFPMPYASLDPILKEVYA